jgi:hypothetical protein
MMEPFVPVSGEHFYGPEDDMETESAYPSLPDRRRVRLPRLRRPRFRQPYLQIRRSVLALEVRRGVLLVIGALVVAGVFGTLLVQDQLPGVVEAWWPAVIVIGALTWMLVMLARRRVGASLGGAALVGFGLSLLMSTQDIAAFAETAMGMMLVTVGLGIVIRGFLLRQQAPL